GLGAPRRCHDGARGEAVGDMVGRAEDDGPGTGCRARDGRVDAWPQGRRRRDGCSVAAAGLSGCQEGNGAMKKRASCVVRRAWVLLALAVSCGKPDPSTYQSVADRIMVIIPRGATY